jgi:hypothetical protein
MAKGNGIRGKDMPRQARLDSPGTLHHVMVRSIEQRQIVDNEADRADYVRRLGGEINDLKPLDEALELGVVKERGKGLVAL